MFKSNLLGAKSGESVIRLSPNQGQLFVNGSVSNLVVSAGVAASVAGAVVAGRASGSYSDPVAVDFLRGVGRYSDYFPWGFNIVRYSWNAANEFVLGMGAGRGSLTFGAFVKVEAGDVSIPGAVNCGRSDVVESGYGGWDFMAHHVENGDVQSNPTSWPDGVTAGYRFLSNARLNFNSDSGSVLVALPALVSGVGFDSIASWGEFVGIDSGVLHNGLKGDM